MKKDWKRKAVQRIARMSAADAAAAMAQIRTNPAAVHTLTGVVSNTDTVAYVQRRLAEQAGTIRQEAGR